MADCPGDIANVLRESIDMADAQSLSAEHEEWCVPPDILEILPQLGVEQQCRGDCLIYQCSRELATFICTRRICSQDVDELRMQRQDLA